MTLPTQKIQLVAAEPISTQFARVLPSVLVSTTEGETPCGANYRFVGMRPRSVVVTSEAKTEWLEIRDTTADTLSVMAAAAAGIAVVSMVLLGIIKFLKRP